MTCLYDRLRPLAWLAQHPVARRRPLRTMLRWAYWQCRQQVTNRPKVISFVNGTRLEVAPHSALTGCWYVVLPEYEEMAFLLRLLRPGDEFFDVGANAGAFSVLAASCGSAVVAFEPNPAAFDMLQRNVTLNSSFGPIVAENIAVGSSATRVRMTTEYGAGNHVLKDNETAASVQVNMTTLDDYCRRCLTPTFIKLDVEGHELEVALGARQCWPIEGFWASWPRRFARIISRAESCNAWNKSWATPAFCRLSINHESTCCAD